MQPDRRAFLALSGSTLAAVWLSADPEEARAALRYAQDVVSGTQQAAWQYLTPPQAADVEAISAQIIPSEPNSPGAREAGVVYFVDKSLATWAADQREPFTKRLDELNAAVAKRWPGTARFAGLTSPQQIELLKANEKTPFFELMRTVTLMAFFGNPSYGGNRNKAGWKLIGFEDRYAWQPPFGDYDTPRGNGRSLTMREFPMRRYTQATPVDFVIVGSGASGGVIARELSRAGLSVVVLEQGPWRKMADFHHDEIDVFFNSGLTNDPKTQKQTFRKTEKEEAKEAGGIGYHKMVGGGSVCFTANYWRLHEIDFVERTKLGAIPGSSLVDWPIRYQDLEPYYTRAEQDLGVSGQAGASPFDPPRSKPYPLPPMPVKSSGVIFDKAAKKLGLHPFPAPLAIISQPYKGRTPCQHCGYCLGFGCEYGAKSSTLFTTIPEAVATGKCEIRPLSYVRKVEVNDRGRVTGVTYFDKDKVEHFQAARAVVVCANGSETPRLLLMSKSAQFPNGLANSSGVVGKNLMFNGYSANTGIFEGKLNEYKSVMATRILHDFYEADLKRGFYGGGGIDARFFAYPILFAQGGLPADAPKWGLDFKHMLRDYYTHAMNVDGHTTSLPVETNSISLDPKLKDAWGMPAMRVTYKDHADDIANMKFFEKRCLEILDAAAAKKTWSVPIEEQTGGVHLLGTCRMGDDPKTSVIDKYHRTHDVRNLFLCDGSSMVTGGRGQPTATIQALAFRAGELIAGFAKRNEI